MSALRRRSGAQAGFTLIELTVSLVAGLIVALGIMTLSKEATRTFNEEMRGSAAEATLRTAVDRLRADLQRAGYMSTGNIMLDPMIARAPSDASNVVHTAVAMKGILRLASVNLTPQGSFAQNGLALSSVQTPNLAPDMFELGGNFTVADEFPVQMIVPSTGACTRINLSAASPAIYRLAPTGFGSAVSTQELRNAFQPVPSGMSTQFIVRLVDTTGHTQYLATCAEAVAAGFTGTQPYVDVDTTSTPIQTAAQTGTQGGVSGYCVGCMVNPVQIVRWEINSATNEAATLKQYSTALGQTSLAYGTASGVDATKYDLIRSFVDATGVVVPETSEIVAEYAVDLSLAFSVDTTTLGDVFPSITTYAFDDTANALWGKDVSTVSPPVANQGPQRIRSARVRVVTRAAQADRTVNVGVTNFGTQTFLYRYCINAVPSCATNDQTLRWARSRTITTEVALVNQSTDFF
jgi:prepilin-type N-terminal cleavage/methylation domain-containing protein